MILGIDIGGTFIKLGLVRGRKIHFQQILSTGPLSSNPAMLQNELVEAARPLVRRYRIRAVGIGIPGLVRYPQGIVDSCANLPGWRGIGLQTNLSRRLGMPVRVDNDVHAMTLAEWHYGAGRGVQNLLCLTLGTGVGGGLVLNGKLYRSAQGPSAEIGHVPIAEEGLSCPCGGKGCLERYVGNRHIVRAVQQRLKSGEKSIITRLVGGRLERIQPETIDEACRKGDPFAQEIWRTAGEQIGLILAGTVNLLCPERIVIGGGIAQAGRWLFEPIRRTVRRRAMRGLGNIPIVAAKLGPSAGIVGAVLLAGEALKR